MVDFSKINYKIVSHAKLNARFYIIVMLDVMLADANMKNCDKVLSKDELVVQIKTWTAVTWYVKCTVHA